jgi:hypothetical protein
MRKEIGGRVRAAAHRRWRIWPEALADTAEPGDELRRLEGDFVRENKGEGRAGSEPFIGGQAWGGG